MSGKSQGLKFWGFTDIGAPKFVGRRALPVHTVAETRARQDGSALLRTTFVPRAFGASCKMPLEFLSRLTRVHLFITLIFMGSLPLQRPQQVQAAPTPPPTSLPTRLPTRVPFPKFDDSRFRDDTDQRSYHSRLMKIEEDRRLSCSITVLASGDEMLLLGQVGGSPVQHSTDEQCTVRIKETASVTFPNTNSPLSPASLTLERRDSKASLALGTSLVAYPSDKLRFQVNEAFTGGGWALVLRAHSPRTNTHDDL